MVTDAIDVATPQKEAPAAAPPRNAQNVLPSRPVQDTKALFDSIAEERIDFAEKSGSPTLRTLFAGLLWLGYSVAVIVALMLIWSAASGLLKSFPR